MRKRRANTQPEDRVAILKRHLVEKVPVSDLCDEFDIQPTQFYQWQKVFFENGAAAFARKNPRRSDVKDRRIAALEEKLAKKNEVLSELMEEHVALKKSFGDL
jgi:transposase-like protein